MAPDRNTSMHAPANHPTGRSRPGAPTPARTPLRGLVRMLWRQPFWAIPFALFFGLLNDGGIGPRVYLLAYEMSLVFAYAIGLALWVVRFFVEPRIVARAGQREEGLTLRIGLTFTSAALLASFVASVVIHLTILPSFLGSPRAIVISGVYTLLFVALFSGISYAQVFYRQAIERARAVETIRAELAQAELRALRAQIHPHFLFNTLNSIAALIRIDPNAAEDTTTRLADVFRYALRASDTSHARLADELAFVREVLAIERTRFGGRLRVSESIDPGVADVLVPTLLLQPLVENAVRYAVATRPAGGTIEISAARTGDGLLRLAVRDDGPGIDPEAQPSGTGFGLHSVRERLRAAGPPHAFDLHSVPGGGTEAVITLPLDPSNVVAVPSPKGACS